MHDRLTFLAAYHALEKRMRALSAADGDIFLPNTAPEGPVDYVLICMEPSLGHWAETKDQAEASIEAGFRNFLWSIEDFILHFCAKEYLCGPAERYHVTDLSKGAMRVKAAAVDRFRRYDRWYDFLLEELALVCRATARIVAVGRNVEGQLRRRGFPIPFTTVIHYSGQAAAARKAGIRGREKAFADFGASVSMSDVVRWAEVLLAKPNVRDELREEILTRLKASDLGESRLQLMFNYMLAFRAVRTSKVDSTQAAS